MDQTFIEGSTHIEPGGALVSLSAVPLRAVLSLCVVQWCPLQMQCRLSECSTFWSRGAVCSRCRRRASKPHPADREVAYLFRKPIQNQTREGTGKSGGFLVQTIERRDMTRRWGAVCSRGRKRASEPHPADREVAYLFRKSIQYQTRESTGKSGGFLVHKIEGRDSRKTLTIERRDTRKKLTRSWGAVCSRGRRRASEPHQAGGLDR